MSDQGRNLVYESGQWQVHLGRRELRAQGVPVPIGARAFEIVEVLVRSANELVTKDDLMARIWPGATVGENTLQVHISAIRKALGRDRAILKTASGRGYRLLGQWTARPPPIRTEPVVPAQVRETTRPVLTNLPLAVVELVGRANAVHHLQDLLSACRIVTLTGPGGIGKTSLALQVASQVRGEFADGEWLVELGSLSDPALVPSAVAQVLRLGLSGVDITTESVARAVGGKHLLLLLDNCEHVIDVAATLAETLVRLCPGVTILATGREALRVQGEWVYRVPPLEVPPEDQIDTDIILRHSASQLFIARTRDSNLNFATDARNVTAIAAICRHLDGIPLAIEFAAARAVTLGIQQVSERLGDRFTLLTSGRRTAVPRHQTLRATLDWSYELLPEKERLLLRHLAVFAGGFSLGAAVAVTSHADVASASVVEGIAGLVARSLVVLDAAVTPNRWRLLETIRAYAQQKLTDSNEIDAARRCHARYFRDLLARSGADSQLSDADLAGRVQELDNVRAALDWAFSRFGDIDIGIDLTAEYGLVWLRLSLIAECRERCERALIGMATAGHFNTRRQMQLHAALGSALIATMGSADQTKAVVIKTLEIAEHLGDLEVQARALVNLSSVLVFRGEYGSAQLAKDRLSQVAHQIGDPAITNVADRYMGQRLLTIGRLHEAREYFERVLQRPVPHTGQQRAILDHSDERATTRAMLAMALCLQGFTEQAETEARASLNELHGTTHQLSFCRVLYYGLCHTALLTGDLITAEQSIAQLNMAATSSGAPFWQVAGRFLEAKLMVERREFANGLAVLREAFDRCRRTGWRVYYPEFMGALAEAFLGLGQLGEALDAINDAVVSACEGSEGPLWYVPELLRIKGEVLLHLDPDRNITEAEQCFDQAARMAREQNALFWELRVALSLARRYVAQGRDADAGRILQPVYDRFTEGFAAACLRAARAVLDASAS